jgi:chitinase
MKRTLLLAILAPLLLSLACVTDMTSPGGGGPGSGGDDDGITPGSPDAGTYDPPPPPPGGSKRIVGYFAAWDVYGRNYQPTDIPFGLLTHVNYAFMNISADGTCILGDPYADIDKFYPGDSWDAGAVRGSFHQLELAKQAHPDLRVILSVGGWSWSAHFSDLATTDAGRKKFAASCVDFVAQYGFDGLDIDWEYPGGGGLAGNSARPEDRQNYVALLAALRAELDARAPAGQHWDLTIAAPAGPDKIAFLDLPAVAAQVDWINVMTYDFHGAWDTTTGFNAPLYAAPGDPGPAGFDADSAIAAYLAAGISSDQIVLGVPFYGRGWAGVPPTNDGLWQPATGPSPGTWEAGVLDWHDLAQNYLPRLTRHFDDAAQVPWLYDAATGVMITFDDPDSLARKVGYANTHALGGVMFWELSGDDGQHTLLAAIHQALHGN